jgi:hypothetical protein
MTPLLLVFSVVAALMVRTLAGIYLGGDYVCPACGARREDQHAEDCPWKRRPSASR